MLNANAGMAIWRTMAPTIIVLAKSLQTYAVATSQYWSGKGPIGGSS